VKNDRPIDNPDLQRALNAIQGIMRRYDLAGAVMLVAPEEVAFAYKMDATWSAIRPEPGSPLGFRIRAKSAEDGATVTRQRVEGAAHTICQLSDFGAQTMGWMEQLKAMLRSAGIEFDHTPFGGKPLPSIVAGPKSEGGF
jgi:hypothetical protein